MTVLDQLTPAAEEGWWTLFELAGTDTDSWLLIGGQMMHVLAAEHGLSELVRPTDDVDVVVNVRLRQHGVKWLSDWLLARGFSFVGASPDMIGGRFVRDASGGPGRTIFDVLAPDGLNARTKITTVPPARTVQAPGSTQAFGRSDVIEVTVSGMSGRAARSGLVRRPSLLGALVIKAAATNIPVRENPDRDWQDAALLLSAVPDPVAAAAERTRSDRRLLRHLEPLENRDHRGWDTLDDEAYRQGTATLAFLLDA